MSILVLMFLTIYVAYKIMIFVASKAIAADERADSDFGYRGRYSRLDSWE